MGRFRFVVSALLAVVLVCSLFFVPGSFAEPLGAGLLASFGVSSGGSSGTQATTRGFDLPVTVTNPQSMPVPVTVQGTSSQPLTATIDGTVSTNQENVPGSQPFEAVVDMDFGAAVGLNKEVAVPEGKMFIIRYVSGDIAVGDGETLGKVHIWSGHDGILYPHRIYPQGSVTFANGETDYHYAFETWLECERGTDSIIVDADRSGGQAVLGIGAGELTLTGYLIDAPTTPAP